MPQKEVTEPTKGQNEIIFQPGQLRRLIRKVCFTGVRVEHSPAQCSSDKPAAGLGGGGH